MTEQMKYIIIVGDGMADYPIDRLGGKTPLGAAKTPHLDWLARHGELGLVKTVPDGFNPGSEIANLALMGYDPARYFTGRGPIEAASLGVKLESGDVAFRCNLVTLTEGNHGTIMEDFAAGHISDAEAREIILDLDREMGSVEFRFYPGVSYRHLMVWRGGIRRFPGLEKLDLTPPHDIIGKEISTFAPRNENSEGRLLELMKRSQVLLKDHRVNRDRLAGGRLPATSVWLWGQGRMPEMITLRERFGKSGCVISAVHLIKGIGILAGLDVIEVPGATGYFDTNYAGKAEYALRGLETRDLAYVHVEAPDEAGHMGDLRLKMECIEAFDEKIVGPLLKGLERFKRYKVLVVPDHPTPISLRTHSSEAVPFAIYCSNEKRPERKEAGFDEFSAGQTGVVIEKGHELMGSFLAS